MSFYQKYRPKNFSELIGEDHISLTLIEGVRSGKLTHAYLLTGPRGTGKTSTARLLAKAINCEAVLAGQKEGKEISGEPCNQCESCLSINKGNAIDIVEIDAASHTKVDEIREVIENANFLPAKLHKKIYIIDEVHMLSNSSFNALLKTLEEPPAHVVFILATTDVNKLPATILSRTQRFDFHRVSKEDIIKNLEKIAKSENIQIDKEALDLVAVKAEGGHRDAISIFEQIASASKGEITKELVGQILGMSESEVVYEFIGAIFNNNPEEGLKIAHRLFDEGKSMPTFNKSVIEALRKILLYKISESFLFEDTKENLKQIKALADKTDSKELIEKIDCFIKTNQLLKDVSYPILPIEMAIVEASSSREYSTEAISKPVEVKKVITRAPVLQEVQASPLAKSEQKQEKKISDGIWHEVVEKAKKESSTLAALLRDAKPTDIADGKVTLGVKFPFHKDKISEEKNRTCLEGIFSEILGQKCIITCEITNLKPKPKGESIDLEKAAEEVFN